MKKTFYKKLSCIIASSIMILSLASCSENANDSSSNDSNSTDSNISSNISEVVASNDKIPYSVTVLEDENKINEIESFLKEKLGTVDEETGNTFSYNVDGGVDYNGKTFYLVWIRWLVTDGESGTSHSSRVGELIVSDDLSTVYSADVDGVNINITKKNLV